MALPRSDDWQPLGEVINDAREEPRLGRAENEAQHVEAGFAAHERHRHGRSAPGEHDPGQPDPRAVALQQHVRRHLEQSVTDEEQPGAKSVSRCADTQIGLQMAAHEADVDPIDVIDDEHHHEQRQHVAFDLGGGAGEYRDVRRTLNGFQGATPDLVFLGMT